jgi:hypothetical protein
VWEELRPYFWFMLIIMWGFACAFNIALRHDQEEQEVSTTSTGWEGWLAVLVGACPPPRRLRLLP